jgi:malonate transporter
MVRRRAFQSFPDLCSMSISNALFPVIAVAALGYAARYYHWLNELEAAGIERIAFWFLIPCLLFTGAATAEFPAQMHWSYLGAFYLVMLLVYGLGMLLGKYWFGYSLRELSIFGMGGAYANATVLGIPITLAVLGETAIVPMLVIICVHNLMIFALGTALAEWQPVTNSRPDAMPDVSGPASLPARLWRVCTEMLLNPISGSLLAGSAFNLLGFTLFAPLHATLDLLGQAAVPGAVFGLGAALTRYHVRGELVQALVMVALKLCFMPALMWWAMTQVFEVELFWARTATMIAAMPVGISVYVFSRRYASCETVAATAIVLSSLASVVTITFWAWLIQP